jgi:hypothetical protein
MMRGGKVVRTLRDAQRRQFGITAAREPILLDLATMNVGEEILQPGDWHVLHTDDLIKARDCAATCSGPARLADLLHRETAGRACAARGTAPPVPRRTRPPGRDPAGRRHSRAGSLERPQAGLTQGGDTARNGYLDVMTQSPDDMPDSAMATGSDEVPPGQVRPGELNPDEHALLERLSGDEREDVIEAEEDTGDYERAVEDDSTLRYE